MMNPVHNFFSGSLPLVQVGVRDRKVGASQSTNHILGGILLHQRRRALDYTQVGLAWLLIGD